MKKSALVKIFALGMILCFGFTAFGEDKPKEEVKDAKETKEAKKGGEAVEKLVLCDFAKSSTQFEGGEFVAEHLTAGETMRCKLTGDGGISRLSKKKTDWSNYNYLVFNVFVEGKEPWIGMILVGDLDSYKKWGQNYVESSISFKPGENKNIHFGVEGLFCTYANRPLDMKNMQIFKFFNGKPTIYLGNMVLVKEEE